jgi:succinate dehydrogenase / fumarate reductase cytochrome b subunit
LIQHLFLNSQAALFIGEDGKSFVDGVNNIHGLPYLILIEIFLLGVPILIHAYWGVLYLRTSQQNAYGHSGNKPHLAYPRNRAYTWQRITSWLLLVGIIAHVIQMRVIDYPVAATVGTQTQYIFPVEKDSGLDTLAARLGFTYYNAEQVQHKKQEMAQQSQGQDPVAKQKMEQEQQWMEALEHKLLQQNQVMVVADNFGVAELLLVRETFKMPLMIALYTIFVLAACFHAFNGLWTFLITWGVTLTQTSQRIMLRVAQGLMVVVASFGLAAIWLTYWFNLKY